MAPTKKEVATLLKYLSLACFMASLSSALAHFGFKEGEMLFAVSLTYASLGVITGTASFLLR